MAVQSRTGRDKVRATIADHIVERGLGGIDGPESQRASCPACHNKRHPSKGGIAGG
jgi:HNH endonuclease